MTRIYVIIASKPLAIFSMDDPRSRRELMVAINTGKERIGAGGYICESKPQWARPMTPMNVLAVALEKPPYKLTPRQYEVLLRLSDGKKAEKVAAEMKISRRQVYRLISELKERMGAVSIYQMLAIAESAGMLDR